MCACVWLFASTGVAPLWANQDDLSAEEVLRKVTPIDSQYHNSIPLLNNRFRIDSDVAEVTLVFFRDYGSAPVVLVRPDGSKLYLDNDSVDDSYTWYETDTYDMIALKNPMPGPWQAVGRILPESRVMVIADIQLETDPIPKLIFSGETLKMTARLSNGGQSIDLSEFKDVVILSVDFASTNNPNYENFGLGSRNVARFEDNGMGYDEKNSDGVFTGQFNLQIAPGEWQPIISVRTPLYSREKVLNKIVLQKSPLFVSHVANETETGFHQLTVDGDPEAISMATLLIDGNVKHPTGEISRFSVTEMTDGKKVIDIENTDYGTYRINMTVFAQSMTGRDLVLTLPEYSFETIAPPPPPEPVEAEGSETEGELAVVEKEIEEEPNFLVIGLIINFSLMLVGGVIIFFIVDKRRNPDNPILQRMKNKLGKISFKFGKKEQTTAENA